MGYFPAPQKVPDQIREYIARQFGFAVDTPLLDEAQKKVTLHHHRAAVRDRLSSIPYSHGGKNLASQAIAGKAETMSDPADLVNVAVEEFGQSEYRIASIQHD